MSAHLFLYPLERGVSGFERFLDVFFRVSGRYEPVMERMEENASLIAFLAEQLRLIPAIFALEGHERDGLRP